MLSDEAKQQDNLALAMYLPVASQAVAQKPKYNSAVPSVDHRGKKFQLMELCFILINSL
jgi:hypothetical protein